MRINDLLIERHHTNQNSQILTEAFFGDTGVAGTIKVATLRTLATVGILGAGTIASTSIVSASTAVVGASTLVMGVTGGIAGIVVAGVLAAIANTASLKIDDRLALKQLDANMRRLDAIMKSRDKLIEVLRKNPEDEVVQKKINALTQEMSSLGKTLQKKMSTRVQLQDILTGRKFANYASLISAFPPKEREVVEQTLKLAASGELTALKVVK